MDFKNFSFPRENFPRFDNACRQSLKLQKRNNLLRESRCLQEKKNVDIVLCKGKQEAKFPIDINSLVSEKSCTPDAQDGSTFDSSNIDALLKSIDENEESFCIFIADSRETTKILQLLTNNIYVILLAINDDAKTETRAMYHGISNVTAATRETLKREIDNLLEKITLAPLKEICETCYSMFKEKISSNVDTNRNANRNGIKRNESRAGVEKGTQSINLRGDKLLDSEPRQFLLKQTHTFHMSSPTAEHTSGSAIFAASSVKQNSLGFDLNGFKNPKENGKTFLRIPKAGETRERPTENDEFMIQKDKNRKEDILEWTGSKDHTNKEDPERLLEAILAVYGMSNVPDLERPKVTKHCKRINEQMKEELFKSCPTIKRMGYRYRTFYIYAEKPVSQEDEEVRNDMIRSILKKYDIFPYEIAHCYEEIQELMHTGAKIEARSRSANEKDKRSATLGGFVKTIEGNQQYCLLSKHVTEHFDRIYYVESGEKKFLGNMLPETNERISRGLDISAALMNDSVGEESTKFKDTRGIPLRGLLHEYNEEDEDNICRSGQAVHFNGAASKLGIGEITMPIVDKGLKSPLIQVEDIDEDGAVHFAEEGDSGAVMCVEDPERKHVHAVGMVIGMVVEDVSTDSSRRKYLAVPLSKGIQQIEELTNTRLELM